MPIPDPFKVKHDIWLKTEADRIEPFILMPKFWHKAWTPQSLQSELHDLGLGYSLEGIREISDELHNRGIVEDVPEE